MQQKRILHVRPWIQGEYSRVFVIPAWWLRVNGRPDVLEVEITLDSLTIRAKSPPEKAEDDASG